MLQLPCQEEIIILPVILKGNRQGTAYWSWNGNTEKPTLKPSVLIHGSKGKKDEKSHSFINDGIVKYLSDCSHDFKNKEMELKDIDWDF